MHKIKIAIYILNFNHWIRHKKQCNKIQENSISEKGLMLTGRGGDIFTERKLPSGFERRSLHIGLERFYCHSWNFPNRERTEGHWTEFILG